MQNIVDHLLTSDYWRIGTMLRKIFSYFALPLLLLGQELRFSP
jgi:hypothetical protein